MKTYICILGRQRSGTTVFRELLKSQGIHDVGEVFHQNFQNNELNFYNFISKKIADDKKFVHPIWQREAFAEFLDYLESFATVERLSLDVKYNAVNIIDMGTRYEEIPSLIKELASRKAYFIHVRRRNKLRVLISESIAQKTGVWGTTERSNGEALDEKRIRLNPLLALEKIKRDEAFESNIRKWISNYPRRHDLFYEEMFTSDGGFSETTIAVVRDIISSNSSELNLDGVSLVKQNPEALRDLVVNFDDLKSVFSDTPYAWMTST